jgi:hypothetical protein
MQALGKDVRDLLALLDKHGVRYLIVGGFAVAVHGTPRYTKTWTSGTSVRRSAPWGAPRTSSTPRISSDE